MPHEKKILLSNLLLDVKNPRIRPVDTQEECIQAIYEDKSTQFRDLIESIMEKGFYRGELILVTPHPQRKNKYIVREGNRRISALKILHDENKKLRKKSFFKKFLKPINDFSSKKKEASKKVFCVVFEKGEEKDLDNEIASRHLSGNTPRLDWPPVRKAKKARDQNGKNNWALDLYERYIERYPDSKDEWDIKFPLTILDDFMKPLAKFLGYGSEEKLTKTYPDPATEEIINQLISDIYDNSEGSGIREPQNRRRKAQEYLQNRYKKPKMPLSDKIQEGPYERGVKGNLEIKIVDDSPKVSESRLRDKDMILAAINQMANLSTVFPSTPFKLHKALVEIHDLLKVKKYEISASVMLRMVFEHLLRAVLSGLGKQPKKSKTLQEILDNVYQNINNEEIREKLSLFKTTSLDLLHKFVHSPEVVPSIDDSRHILKQMLPVLDSLLRWGMNLNNEKNTSNSNPIKQA